MNLLIGYFGFEMKIMEWFYQIGNKFLDVFFWLISQLGGSIVIILFMSITYWIINKNNGKKAGLDAFHDFRKTFEGYEDDEWGKAEKEWLKSSEGQSRKLADKAWNDYYNKTKEVGEKVSNSLLGTYGNKKLNALGDETYGELVSDNVRDILNEKTKIHP